MLDWPSWHHFTPSIQHCSIKWDIAPNTEVIWLADEVNVTIIPTPATPVVLAVYPPHNFSLFHSDTHNPWRSLSCHHCCSHPHFLPLCKSFKYPTDIPAHEILVPLPLLAPLLLVPVQLIKTFNTPMGLCQQNLSSGPQHHLLLPCIPLHLYLCGRHSWMFTQIYLHSHLKPFHWMECRSSPCRFS